MRKKKANVSLNTTIFLSVKPALFFFLKRLCLHNRKKLMNEPNKITLSTKCKKKCSTLNYELLIES